MKYDKLRQNTVGSFDTPVSSQLSFLKLSTADLLQLRPMIEQILDGLPQPLWLNTKKNHSFFNTAMTNYLGIDLNEDGGRDWQQFIHPDDLSKFLVQWHEAIDNSQNFELQCRIRHASMGYRMCLISMNFHHDLNQPLQWVISLTDIHDYFEIQQQLSQVVFTQKNMLDACTDSIKLMTPEGQLCHMNRAGYQALDLDEKEHQTDTPWLKLLPPEYKKAGQRALKRASQGMNARFTAQTQSADQPVQHWDNLLTPVVNEQNVTEHILCVTRNISQQKKTETRLKAVIELDDLTGLYNRRTFYKQFKRAMYQAEQKGTQLGLLLIDLDYFKHINDTLGHIAGDHLLHVLGERFKNCFGKNTVVSRLGGDEFVVLIKNLEHEDQLIQTAYKACTQMDLPINYAGKTISGGMSIGCSMYPRDAASTSNLLKCADIALNDLKNSGRGGIRLFNQDMLRSMDDMTKQLTLARRIIKTDQIIPYYQPKVRLSDGAVIGFEALLRWVDPHHQIQLPSHIFCAFQDYELASRISETMQNKVFADMTRWQEQGLDILPISINAAPVEFLRDDYAEKMLKRLSKFNIPAHKVELEITEQSLAEHGANYVIRALTLLKEAGIQISLDDFGTGHSSLTRLQDYPVDCIKIDRNFVERLNRDPSALAIVKAIAQIGSSISLDVLVEGIENTEQLDVLKNCDCRIGQGFYFYHPMASQFAKELLSTSN